MTAPRNGIIAAPSRPPRAATIASNDEGRRLAKTALSQTSWHVSDLHLSFEESSSSSTKVQPASSEARYVTAVAKNSVDVKMQVRPNPICKKPTNSVRSNQPWKREHDCFSIRSTSARSFVERQCESDPRRDVKSFKGVKPLRILTGQSKIQALLHLRVTCPQMFSLLFPSPFFLGTL